MGGSAGAIIFAKSIIPATYHDMNWVELKNFDGMNVINNWEITCHYESSERNMIKSIIAKNSFEKLIALSEKNGLYVNNNEIKIIGQESAIIFNENGDETELEVGEILK